MVEIQNIYTILEKSAKLIIISAVILMIFKLIASVSLYFFTYGDNLVITILRILEDPVETFIILYLWLKIITLIIETFIKNGELVQAFQTSSFLVPFGYFLYLISGLENLHIALAILIPILNFGGLFLVMGGLVHILYYTIRYIWSLI